MCVSNNAMEIKPENMPQHPQLENLPEAQQEENLEDLLYSLTRCFKEVLDLFEKHFWRLNTVKSQIVHVIAIAMVASVCFMCYKQPEAVKPSVALAFCYIACFGIHLGTQFWMTFMSGLSLYFTLPRHTFGSVQKVLFPRYFFINSILSFVTLLTFLRINFGSSTTERNITFQAVNLTTCFILEFLISIYLTTPLVELITEKNLIEAANGLGWEIGRFVAGDLVICPHYKKVYRRFRRLHGTIALGNVFAMTCSVFHLYYLAYKISTANVI